MLLKDFIRESVISLKPLYSEGESLRLVQMLCEGILGVRGYTHVIEPDYRIDATRLSALRAAMTRLAAGEPVQYVLGYAWFGDYRFNVSPAVLVPRPETELLVREAVRIALPLQKMRSAQGAPSVRILDLCTGSGCIAWSLALEVPGAEVVALDISGEALEVAENQPMEVLLREKKAIPPQFVRADVLDTANSTSFGTFDILVSNPPYVMESEKFAMHRNVLDYEPALALFVPDDDPLIFYRAIASWAVDSLAEQGCGFVEINEGKGKQTANAFSIAGLRECRILQDFHDKDRIVSFVK